jgi:hypothetical protein
MGAVLRDRDGGLIACLALNFIPHYQSASARQAIYCVPRRTQDGTSNVLHTLIPESDCVSVMEPL